MSFPRTNVLTDFAVSVLPDSGRFAGNSARDIVVGTYVFPPYLTLYNGATSADGGKFIQNNNDYGGTSGALPAHVKAPKVPPRAGMVSSFASRKSPWEPGWMAH